MEELEKKVRGVLCDRKIGVKLQGKVHRAVLSLLSTETWAIKRTEKKKMDMAEMRMLRWLCGVKRRDKIRNEVIMGTTGVRELSDKIQESRLSWYGHVMRRDEHYIRRRLMKMEVTGSEKERGTKANLGGFYQG
ncbi:uncharacterized protein [Palaemon carinicauda]|uniref:uncharacterized protein n=1 Tax=Palaemon carinicauda TaxID=392227 RepID=UPI0035B5F573